MNEISKLNLSGTIFKVKDSTARKEIEDLKEKTENTIKTTEQPLTSEQQHQVIENLGLDKLNKLVVDNNGNISINITEDEIYKIVNKEN